MAGKTISSKALGFNTKQLSARSMEALRKATPTAQEILDNADAYNQEIKITAASEGIDLVKPEDALNNLEITPSDELDRLNAEFDEKLKAQAARKAAEEAAAAKKAAEEGAKDTKKEMTIEDQVLDLLHNSKNAPSEAQIAAWKKTYGDDAIQLIAFGEKDVFIFTYLTRMSFQKIQIGLNKQAQIEGIAKDPEEFMMEQVIKQCVLFPKLPTEFFYNSRSGIIPTLYSSIMLHSYHLTPQQAMMFTVKL